MPRLFLQNTPWAFFEREMMAVPGFGRRRQCEEDMERSMDEYQFPTCDGCFIGTLVTKRWNSTTGLNCYFDGADGQAYILCAWRREETPYGYCPLYTDLDLSMLPVGTMLKVKYRISRSGKCKWLEADVLQAAG